MPGKVAKIGTFSDWVGMFDDWRKEIGVNHDEIADFKFDTLYGAIETEEIQFGHFKGRRKWENLRQVRRAFDNQRLLGAFNVDVDNWMDFFTYTDFVDRDGKFQLQMLKYSAFAPLGRSMSYMLREEAFHMGTGNDGLRRIVEAGVIPAWLIQRYLNKWISSSYDLFGTDHSSSAHWAYVWGIKGRYDEPKNEQEAKLDELNDYNRQLYRDEVAGLIERFNTVLKPGEPKLYAPDIKFNRAIGRWAGLKFHAQTGEPLDDRAYEQHLKEYMPTPEDKTLLLDIIRNEKKWIVAKEGGRDPLATIGEPRKSAINL